MSVNIRASLQGHDKVLQTLDALSGQQAKDAYAKAVNDTAFQVRRAMQAEMQAVFDRPTGYVVRSPRVDMATADKMQAAILPTYDGQKGIDPQKILQAQAFGGGRRDKRSEVVLRRAGLLPSGMQTTIPAEPYPGSVDGYGNVRGQFMVQLLSYLKAFSGSGARANMSERRRRSLHRGNKAREGRKYVVSDGQRLPAGIWAVSGQQIKPVLMFVKAGRYKVKLDMQRVAKRADAANYLSKRLRYRIRQAAGI